ncbi:MAG: alpha amylase C-terminal domain-containing protein, partial [Clostridiales bacterium]|nr:alpha amylase C-terminal domain-containing protein [Clostridiales bacterium]
GYRIGVPEAGTYRVIFDSAAAKFGGGKSRTGVRYKTANAAMHGHPQSIALNLAGLDAVYLEREEKESRANPPGTTTHAKPAGINAKAGKE